MKTSRPPILLRLAARIRGKSLFAGLVFSLTITFLPPLDAQNLPEPAYKGKTLSYWLDEYDAQKYMLSDMLAGSEFLLPFTLEQTNAVLHMGTNALPWLVKRFYNPQYSARGTIQAFRVLGPLARSAIPDMLRVVTNRPEDPTFRGDVGITVPHQMLALGGIGKDSLPALLEILTNSMSSGRRYCALEAIASIGTNASAALPVLERYANDADDMVAHEAVETIAAVGARQSAGFQALERRVNIKMLIDRSPGLLTNAQVLRNAATDLRSADFDRQDWATEVLRAADQQARGQRPDYAVPGGDMNATYREATNALSRLSPQLYGEYVAAHVPFHKGSSH